MSSSDSLFPEAPRVLYDKSPLNEVICQFRFPSILRIDTQPPADFQDLVRKAFPIYERANSGGIEQLPVEIAQMLGAPLGSVNHVFKAEDEKSRLAVTKESLALVVNDYERWESFKSQLDIVRDSFVKIYQPAFFSRIGLRYSNVISRSDLGLEGRLWSELLIREVLGEIAVPLWEERLLDARRTIRVKMSDGTGSIFFQHGLANIQETNETCYLIDFDFYTDKKTGIEDASGAVEKFHERSGRAFRWCVTKLLHDAMGPKQLDDDRG